jgi:dTDP-4-amino-4,6-dideoxygalactose transaminase
LEERTALIKYLKDHEVLSVFHYLSLHKSEYYLNNCDLRPELPNCDKFADCLVRLPMFYELTNEQVEYIVKLINNFYADK